jgi:DNA-binding response OmpR family regulator
MSVTPERVLLVNDDLFFSARILSVLRQNGYLPETASTAQQALERAAALSPALVILNLGSERLGGLQTLRRLKSETGAPRVLAFLSHVRIPEIRAAALEAGADKLCPNSAVSLRLPTLIRQVLDGTGEKVVEDEE